MNKMNGNLSLPLAVVFMLGIAPDCGAQTYTVDDSYTVSQRYRLNKERFPELELPVVQFERGQRAEFDRGYKQVRNRELHIDIFLPAPADASRHAIVLVHGGGWRSGNKSHFYPLANLLAQRGYIVFLPEYRLSPEAQYPAGLNDLNDAIVWVKQQATVYDFDCSQLAIGGASSGGQMAALLAYTSNTSLFKTSPDDDTRVSALIDLDGLLDFTTPLAVKHENKAGDKSAAGLWFGGALEKVPEKWQQASAARHVHPEAPPTLIISSGQPRFTAGADSVLGHLDEYGIRNKYMQYDEILHTFWLFEPYVSEVAIAIDQFLASAELQ